MTGPVPPGDVPAFTPLRSNAVLIEHAYRLDYIREDDRVLDATYGTGAFWRLRQPRYFLSNDADPETAAQRHYDFRCLAEHFEPRAFDVIVYDPPYKLNGTPSGPMDLRYGVGQPTRWQDRMQQCRDGVRSCCDLEPRTLLIKCMSQVVSGRVVWQPAEFEQVARARGYHKTDELLMHTGRPQPAGRRQVHARRNYSTMLVMEKGTRR